MVYAIGFAYAAVVGHYALVRIGQVTLSALTDEQRRQLAPALWLSKQVGTTERTLYVAALALGQPGFIAVWLALKAVGPAPFKLMDTQERLMFQRFMLMMAISLAYGVVGWRIAVWSDSTPRHVAYAVAAGIGLMGATVALERWLALGARRVRQQTEELQAPNLGDALPEA